MAPSASDDFWSVSAVSVSSAGCGVGGARPAEWDQIVFFNRLHLCQTPLNSGERQYATRIYRSRFDPRRLGAASAARGLLHREGAVS
jgi:hypothetical protein